MNVLAKTYGVDDWKEIQRGNYNILLDSFLWGNANSIETPTSDGVNPNAPGYNRAKVQSKMFDSVELVRCVFNPHVIILTCSTKEMQCYLGDGFNLLERKVGRVDVFQKDSLLAFYAPHPRKQNTNKGGSDVYARIVRELLVQYKMFCPLSDVLQHGLSSEAKEILIRECSADKIDKFEAIARIAHELHKQGARMTARSLCVDISNKAGHRTKRGTQYTGKGKGPCSLCYRAYRRFNEKESEPQIADDIAYAFTTNRGFYVYE